MAPLAVFSAVHVTIYVLRLLLASNHCDGFSYAICDDGDKIKKK